MKKKTVYSCTHEQLLLAVRNSEFYSRNKNEHFPPSFPPTEVQVISVTTRNLRASAASSQYAKKVSVGWEVVCISSPLLSLLNCQHFVKVAGVKKKTKTKKAVVSELLEQHSLPHCDLTDYFTSDSSVQICPRTHQDFFVLIVIYSFFFPLSLFLFVDFLPSDTVGRFCSV